MSPPRDLCNWAGRPVPLAAPEGDGRVALLNEAARPRPRPPAPRRSAHPRGPGRGPGQMPPTNPSFVALAGRDLEARYNLALGPAWVVFQPLALPGRSRRLPPRRARGRREAFHTACSTHRSCGVDLSSRRLRCRRSGSPVALPASSAGRMPADRAPDGDTGVRSSVIAVRPRRHRCGRRHGSWRSRRCCCLFSSAGWLSWWPLSPFVLSAVTLRARTLSSPVSAPGDAVPLLSGYRPRSSQVAPGRRSQSIL